MPGSHFRCSHHLPVVVEHADALRQLRVSHEHHVADVCTRCREVRMFFKIPVRRLTSRNLTDFIFTKVSFLLLAGQAARTVPLEQKGVQFLAQGYCGRMRDYSLYD